MKNNVKKSIISCLFLSILVNTNIIIVNSQDDDSGVGTVEVDDNDIDPFFDLDPVDIDDIYETTKTPAPNQVVGIEVKINYIDNTSGEFEVKLFHDDGTDKASYVDIDMTYDSGPDRFNATLGGYPEFTTVYYFVRSYDGKNYVYTPALTNSSLTWQDLETTPPAQVPGGGGAFGSDASKAAAGGIGIFIILIFVIAILKVRNDIAQSLSKFRRSYQLKGRK